MQAGVFWASRDMDRSILGHLVSQTAVFGASLVTDRSTGNFRWEIQEHFSCLLGRTEVIGVFPGAERSILGISCHGQLYMVYLVGQTGVSRASHVTDSSI